MNKMLLMGNEAIALGAIRAGVRVVTGYPGTPSTEILETIAKKVKAASGGVKDGAGALQDIYVEWSVNEKSALEIVAGAAMAGRRAMVTMKQVGLNVASDPLMSLNYVGVEGGLVVVAADDPGPISSQTEQDTRHFALYAKIAVFDPASPEEAYTMIGDAFSFSEKIHRPVILRPTTRVCHSYASVELLPAEKTAGQPAGFDKEGGRWVIFPALAYRNHIQIEKDLAALAGEFSSYPGNRLIPGRNCKKGIASGGVSWAYTMEAVKGGGESGADSDGVSCRFLKISTIPFPLKLCLQFLEGLEEVLVIEELDPVIEKELVYLCGLHHLNVKIRGKLSGDMPNAGENKTDQVTLAIGRFLNYPGGAVKTPAGFQAAEGAPELPVRPPVLCAGCPHRGSFFAVKEAVRIYNKGRKGAERKAVFSGDIGCYTLGNAQPLDMVDTCLCMGAGITIAQGINRSERPESSGTGGPLNFAFIGDSTFFHTGISGIVNAVYNKADIIVVILDNNTTAMTGNQSHPGTGISASGSPAKKISIEALVSAIGVNVIVKTNPFKLEESKETVISVLDKPGVRVIIFEGPCIMVSGSGEAKEGSAARVVEREKCTRCGACVNKLGCPAISIGLKAVIDPVLCTGCGICREVCPFGAIQ